jgi:hypothetical protein
MKRDLLRIDSNINLQTRLFLFLKKDFCLFWFLLVFVLMPMFGCAGVQNELVQNKPCVSMTGQFTLSGSLIHKDSTAVPNTEVFVPIKVKDNWVQKFERDQDSKRWVLLRAGSGNTDEHGKFKFKVNKKYFCEDQIRFPVFVGNPPKLVGTNGKGGAFIIGEADNDVDIGKIIVDSK